MTDDPKYIYIFNDNAYFRMRAGTELACVDEVWTPDGWKQHAGERGKPYLEGEQVAEADVPPFRKPADKKQRIPLNFTEGAQAKVFLILSPRGTPPPLPQTTKPAPDAPVAPPKSKTPKAR